MNVIYQERERERKKNGKEKNGWNLLAMQKCLWVFCNATVYMDR